MAKIKNWNKKRDTGRYIEYHNSKLGIAVEIQHIFDEGWQITHWSDKSFYYNLRISDGVTESKSTTLFGEDYANTKKEALEKARNWMKRFSEKRPKVI